MSSVPESKPSVEASESTARGQRMKMLSRHSQITAKGEGGQIDLHPHSQHTKRASCGDLYFEKAGSLNLANAGRDVNRSRGKAASNITNASGWYPRTQDGQVASRKNTEPSKTS
jgi:hypothetical protein